MGVVVTLLLFVLVGLSCGDESERLVGEEFAKEFSGLPGVARLPESGAWYRVVGQGQKEGRFPSLHSIVQIHYSLSPVAHPFISHYDSSFERKKNSPSQATGSQAATQSVAQSLPGWREALMRMRVGEEWELLLPPGAAYGEIPRGPFVSKESFLLSRLQLVGILRDEI